MVGRKCGGNEAKVRGRILLVRMVFCCVRPLEGCGGIGWGQSLVDCARRYSCGGIPVAFLKKRVK